MTIDERIEKLEFLLAGHIEQAKKDYEENRRLWREQQSHIEAVWMRIERGFAQSRRLHDEGMARMRQEMAARDAVTDKRIADLVLAIGELCRREAE